MRQKKKNIFKISKKNVIDTLDNWPKPKINDMAIFVDPKTGKDITWIYTDEGWNLIDTDSVIFKKEREQEKLLDDYENN